MTPTELAIIERALGECSCTSEEAEQAAEALGKLRQRDWAVRVLDAWAYETGHAVFTRHSLGYGWRTESIRQRPAGEDFHLDVDAARLAAAQAVFPKLPADVRAELGECP